MLRRVGVPERLTGPLAPVPPNVRAAVERIGCELVVLRRHALKEPRFDALLLTGGPTPSREVQPALSDVDRTVGRRDITDYERDHRELAALDRSLTIGRPVLGICRGMQLLAIHAGGNLVPVLAENTHAGPTGPVRRPTLHPVDLAPWSRLAKVTGTHHLARCSSHHRAGVELPEFATARAAGWAPDGTTEAIEFTTGCAVGVLWHPEDTPQYPEQNGVLHVLIDSINS